MKKLILLMVAVVLTINVLAQKYVGGDISMLKKFVDEGAVYKDQSGNIVEPLAFFKQQGWNSMRVRLFVDPTKAIEADRKQGAIQDLAYVKVLGRQIKDAGFSFMLDIHYSDTWTDPGKHSTPSAWSSMSVEQLTAKVYDYTKDCLQQLVDAGAKPDFIQVGNEITTGMLWPTGRIYATGGAPSGGSWDNFAGYLASGTRACKEVCPQAQIVIHTELHAPAQVPAFYNNLAKYSNVQYDIIGLSYYPDYHGALSNLNQTIQTLENNHSDKKIMIVETGYGFKWQVSGATENLTSRWPTTPEGQLKFTKELIDALNDHSNVNGLYWWYPEYTLNNIVFKNGSEYWNNNFTAGYWNAALFWYDSGYALPAVSELKNFLGGDAAVESVKTDGQQLSDTWYTLDGRKTQKPAIKGVYINNHHKVLVK